MNVLGFSGSLRAGSTNTALLRTAVELAPAGMAIELYSRMGELPHYNEDVRLAGPPAIVTELKQRVAGADALLFAVPEYNYAPPGVLKNLIDWVSRPPAENPMRDKPAAMFGAGGRMGTTRSQLVMRQILLECGCHVMGKPELWVQYAGRNFDEAGQLTDDPTREVLIQLLAAFERWIAATGPLGAPA
jgi:chromate reductase, NAD(P)H dehydrogenase (quinone)